MGLVQDKQLTHMKCPHNRIWIWESTRWEVNRSMKKVDIDFEEFDRETSLFCIDCRKDVDDIEHNEIIKIIEKSRDNS